MVLGVDTPARRIAAAGVVAGLLIARFIALGADPPLFKTLSNMTDEGVWMHNAKNLVLYGTPYIDDVAFGPTTAPLLHLLVAAVFGLAGPGLVAARAVSAVAGVLTVLLLWSILRRHYAPAGAYLGLVCFALSDVTFAYSRLALPEMLQLAGLTATLALQLGDDRRGVRSALAGVAWAGAVLAKISAGYLLPAYVLWWTWLAWREGRATVFVRRAIPFLVAAVVILGGFVVVVGIDVERLALMHAGSNQRVLVRGPGDIPRAFLTLITNRFWGTPSIALLLAVVAGLAVARFPSQRRVGLPRLRHANPATVLAAIWLIVPAAILGLTLRLQDEHRFLLFTVPLVLLATSALDIRGRVAPAGAAPTPPLLAGVAAICALAAIGAGLVWTTPWRAFAGSVPTVAVVAALVLVGGGATMAARRRAPSRAATATALVASVLAPVVVAVALVVGHALGALAAGLAVLAVVATFVTWASALRSGGASRTRVALATFLVSYVVLAGTPVLLAVARPRASLPDGARLLATLAPPGSVVTGAFAESLTLDSRLFALWLSPKDPDKGRINHAARLDDVEIVLEDPSRPGPFVRHDELGAPFRERATIPLFFDPVRDEPRVTVKAYVRERR